MTELRLVNGVVGLTTFNHKLVMAPVNAEDVGKRERVAENDLTGEIQPELTTIAIGMFGLWSGKVDAADGQTPQVFVPNAFGREFFEETEKNGLPGVRLHPDQLRGVPARVGKVEQVRADDGRVLLYVFVLPLVEFTWEQMNDLSKRLPPGQELWELPLAGLTDQLNKDAEKIRPTSLIAAQCLLGQQVSLPQSWARQKILSQS